MASRLNRTLTNHDEIRQWAEERGAKPACVLGTGNDRDPGMLRLDFPGYTGEKKLRDITWEEWFGSFDRNNLALIVQDRTAGGQKSNFNKLIARASAERREGAGANGHRKEVAKGSTKGRAKGAARGGSTRKSGTSASSPKRPKSPSEKGR